jgi:ribonuclease D
MITITDTEALARFCESVASADFVTIDTEFMRERTYWSKLCLVQLAGPNEAAIIDTLAEGIDLAPLFSLLNNPDVLKVFHAGRQDIEIFHHLTGTVPAPVFDTQVAGMVCGFGDQVGYETLVSKLAKARIDKTMRFTDWSRRPLSEKQLQYALSDVTHLRVAYEKLAQLLERTGRAHWLEEEMAILTSPNTYTVEPTRAWKRIKFRGSRPRFLCVLQELAAWREEMAQERDVPRNRILRDDVLLDIAARAPETPEELAKTRSVGRNGLGGAVTKGVLAAVAVGKARPEGDCPVLESKPPLPKGIGPLVDLFRVLLKMKCDENGVAQKLVSPMSDLELIAGDDEADVPALQGWRRELFGNDALRLKHGEISLAADGYKVCLIPTTPAGTAS